MSELHPCPDCDPLHQQYRERLAALEAENVGLRAVLDETHAKWGVASERQKELQGEKAALEAELAEWTNTFGTFSGEHVGEDCKGAHPLDWLRDLERAEAERDALQAYREDCEKVIDALKARVAVLQRLIAVHQRFIRENPPEGAEFEGGGRESGRAEDDASGRATAPVRDGPGTIATPKPAAADPAAHCPCDCGASHERDDVRECEG